MGRALIATDVVGCREVVDDGVTGYLVPPYNSQALAEAMIHLIEEPALIEDIGRAANQMVAAKFDERSVIEKTIATYNEILAMKAGYGSTTSAARTERN